MKNKIIPNEIKKILFFKKNRKNEILFLKIFEKFRPYLTRHLSNMCTFNEKEIAELKKRISDCENFATSAIEQAILIKGIINKNSKSIGEKDNKKEEKSAKKSESKKEDKKSTKKEDKKSTKDDKKLSKPEIIEALKKYDIKETDVGREDGGSGKALISDLLLVLKAKQSGKDSPLLKKKITKKDEKKDNKSEKKKENKKEEKKEKDEKKEKKKNKKESESSISEVDASDETEETDNDTESISSVNEPASSSSSSSEESDSKLSSSED
jgi:hypothetical protein